MSGYENHIFSWLASAFCCFGVVWLLINPVLRAQKIYHSITFFPTYTIGILAWLFHGIEIQSFAVIIPCSIQLCVLPLLIVRAIKWREGEGAQL